MNSVFSRQGINLLNLGSVKGEWYGLFPRDLAKKNNEKSHEVHKLTK